MTPQGDSCGTARVIGRFAALEGVVISGDTSGAKNNDDLSTNQTECWDAKYDNYFRIYLVAGEKLDATVTPHLYDFDSMLKLYQGMGCNKGGSPLIGCYNDGNDGNADHLAGAVAPVDGWYTIVVDGRMAFDDDYDWGPYSLVVRIPEAAPGTCCACLANDHLACSGGNLYWYDSCGMQVSLAATCECGCTGSACTCCPSWSCGGWSNCVCGNTQTRTCTDTNGCGMTVGKPAESQSCNHCGNGTCDSGENCSNC